VFVIRSVTDGELDPLCCSVGRVTDVPANEDVRSSFHLANGLALSPGTALQCLQNHLFCIKWDVNPLTHKVARPECQIAL